MYNCTYKYYVHMCICASLKKFAYFKYQEINIEIIGFVKQLSNFPEAK